MCSTPCLYVNGQQNLGLPRDNHGTAAIRLGIVVPSTVRRVKHDATTQLQLCAVYTDRAVSLFFFRVL